MSLGRGALLTRRIAKRYARTLFEAALDTGTLEKAAEDFDTVRQALRHSEDLRHFIANPEIPARRQALILNELFAKRLAPQSQKFLLFLITKDRLSILDDVITAFQGLYREHAGISRLQITSAFPVDQTLRDALHAFFAKHLRREIESEERVDPDLIGGVKVAAGDMVYDLSVRNQLDRFRKRMLTTSLN